MNALRSVLLADRGVVRVSGRDAQTFLQGLITNDMALLATTGAIHAGLLSPQGKILFDFFVVREGDAYLLETVRSATGSLASRLTMYKLRADVSIDDVSADYSVAAVWDEDQSDEAGIGLLQTGDGVIFVDPRLPDMGVRLLVTFATDWIPGELDAKPASHDDYDAHRVRHGIPEGGKDYTYGDTFVHEALFDQLNGVSFSKGCFVGQEVVSRVAHRSTARRRIVPVAGTWPLPDSGNEVRSGSSVLGTLGTVCGKRALANLRLDRVAEVLAAGATIEAAETKLAIEVPSWATFSLDLPDNGKDRDPKQGTP